MKDYMIKAIDETGFFRFSLVRTSKMVQEIRDIHQSSATATAAMGRLATMATIMGSDLKSEKDSLTLKIHGDGPAGVLIAVSDLNGHVKVMANRPELDVASKIENEKLDVGAYVGKNGSLAVIRDYGLKDPYVGYSNLVTGEIAEDFANYFFYSEQTPTVISLGVLVDRDLSVLAAGGLFIQALPDTPESELMKLEEKLKDLKAISELINEGLSPEDILDKYFASMNPSILSKKEIAYQCDCSKEKMEKALISLPKGDLKEIIEEDGEIEMACHFCNSKYKFTKEELEQLIK